MKRNTKWDIIRFLRKNGFKKSETNSYYNSKCNVVFMQDLIFIADNNGDEDAVPISFFAVYGCLIYRNYIKEYIR